MASKTIAIIGSRGIPARYGGFETFAEELSVRLVEKGIGVTVYCEGKSAPSEYRGVKLVHIPAPHLGGLTTLLHDFRTLWHARKRFDVVYMLGYGTSLFCFLPKLLGTPVWMNMDGIEWQRDKWGFLGKTWWKMMETVALYVPDLMICDAEEIKSFLAARHRRMPATAVIPYGADPIEEAPGSLSLDEFGLKPGEYHLIVSRFEPENHVLELFEGYSRSDSKYPLIALGTTRKPNSYTKVLGRIAKDDKRIVLPGPIYDDRLNALRYYARTYLHGHSVGGTNPSLLEAMGSGNAIIAHDNAFNREVASEGAVYFNSSEDVTRLLSELDADESLRERMGQFGIQRIKNSYSWEEIAEMYLELFKEA